MKFFFLLLFIGLFSCNTINNKTYICGDHTCIDNKESKEYFAENLILEIKNKNKNISTVDLVNLNLKNTSSNVKSEKITLLNKNEKRT